MYLARNFLLFLLLLVFGCNTVDEGIDPDSLDKWTYFTKKDGLSDNFVTVIYQDPKGIFWFGHEGAGLTRYDGKVFTKFTTANGLVSNFVNSILYDADSTLLVGTNNGLSLKQRNTNTWQYYEVFVGVPITSILQDKRKVLWFGTNNYGIVKVEGEKLSQELDNRCAKCNYVNAIVEAKDGKIWFGTQGGLKVFDGKSFKHYTAFSNRLSGDNIVSLQEDSWGNMWLGTADGTTVTRYRNGTFEKISLSNSSRLLWVTSIVKGAPGELWFGTVSNGLIHYDGAAMRRKFKEPKDATIVSMYQDKHGAIWMGTLDHGIAKYYPH